MQSNELMIAIARENGSGGREVGKTLADMLGIPCYDREIITAAAEKAGIPEEQVLKEEERINGKPITFYGISAPSPLFKAQSEAILSLASKGSAVFVGRCANYVLRKDYPNLVTVFVHAPSEDRIRRSAARNNISEKEAAARTADKDRERAAYYQRYTGEVWGVASGYSLSIDTGMIGVENAAKLIAEFTRMSQKE